MAVMEQNADLRLPTIAVPVRLAVVGGALVDAEVFVRDTVRTGRTQLLEDVAATFDDDAPFVPVRFATGEVKLLAKRAIAWVEVQRSASDIDVDVDESPSEVITLYDRHHRVVVELVSAARGGRAQLEGSLFDSSPADRPRVIDHLNRARRFLRLWTPRAQTLINTDQILSVSEHR
jgi:hypothetical protein